ncbi:MAG TPA: hypothetical protein EYN89_06515 [Flavobacteriales bacterium]|nr:hypothetical protein [Flavobacteriales bacterium]
MGVLLPHTYLGPIQYYVLLAKNESVRIENHEHFIKQTYRNRSVIYGANGRLNLIVPTVHEGERRAMKTVKISYHEGWQKLHWKSLESSYRSSPFFEYYEDDLAPLINKKHTYLIDLNMALLNFLLQELDIGVKLSFTDSYCENMEGLSDQRSVFAPSLDTDKELNLERYQQVFESRHKFIPNLSILDLLFNLGPAAKGYLLSSATFNSPQGLDN